MTRIDDQSERREESSLDRGIEEGQALSSSASADDEELANLRFDVRQVWREVLKTSKLDDHRGFFDSGGSSIDLLKVLALLNGRFIDAFKLTDLFQHPTIDSQARHALSAIRPGIEDAGARSAARVRLAQKRRQHRNEMRDRLWIQRVLR